MNCGKFLKIGVARDDDVPVFSCMEPNDSIISPFKSDHADLGASRELVLEKGHKPTRKILVE